MLKSHILKSLGQCLKELREESSAPDSVSFRYFFKLCDMAEDFANVFDDEENGLFFDSDVECLIYEVSHELFDGKLCSATDQNFSEWLEFAHKFVSKCNLLVDACQYVEGLDDDDPDGGEEIGPPTGRSSFSLI